MIKTSKPIVFFGSGSVAAQSLELLSRKFNVEAVITKPKRSNSRDPVPVLDLCLKLGIKAYTPKNKNDLNDIFEKVAFKSELGILIDFGIIISKEIIDFFKFGIVNSHFSLLPLYRGADPISFSILSGDKATGVSLMLLNAGIDEGKLIAQNKLGINHYDNLELTHRLVTLSDSMLQKYIPQYLSGEITPYNQSNKIVPTYSRKLSKEDGKINWNKSAEQIEREIRAFIHWPKSFTEISGIPVIITKVSLNKTDGLPGTIVYDKRSMNIKCLNGSLDILSLKPLGRSDMNIASFISGYKNRFRD